jgi:hypothetical protein
MTAPTRIRKRTRNGIETRIQIDRIIVGERARKDMGDIDRLMASMSELGQLQPIVLAPGNELLIGGRRLEAAKRLGWTDLKFMRAEGMDDAIDRLKAERDENTCRKEMTPTELYAVAERLIELERPKAKERQREGGRQGAEVTNSGLVPTVTNPSDRNAHKTDHIVAEALGTTRGQIARIRTVVNAASGVDGFGRPLPASVQEAAIEAKQLMDTGKATIHAAEDLVRAAKRKSESALPDETPGIDELPTEAPDGWSPAKRSSAEAKKQAQTIERVLLQLDGIAMATDFREIHIDAEKASRLAADLSKRVRSLNQLVKQLRKESVAAA